MRGAPLMPSTVDRRAVDLAAFPDLVVIYLGMRVRTFAGIKSLLGLGPQIDKAGVARPEGLLHFETTSFSASSRCISACGGTGRTSTPWSGGRAQSRTAPGGRTSSVTPAARGFGTRRISCAGEWKVSTLT